MNTQRITAQSKANIQAAERAEIVPMKVFELDLFAVKVWKGERAAFVCGSISPMTYPTKSDARRAMKRIRPELELTSFE